MGRLCCHKGKCKSAFKILIGKPTGKRTLRKSMRRWNDGIRMDLKEIGINTRNLIDSTQDRIIGEPLCKCDIEPSGSISHGFSYTSS